MGLEIHQGNSGKPSLVVGKYKYHESCTLKNGQVAWRCLAKSCRALVKTNASRTEIVSHQMVHTGKHPVTNRTQSLPSSPSAAGNPPLSSLFAQTIATTKEDTRNAATETDELFLQSKDGLVSKIQMLKHTQSALVDKILTLVRELESAKEEIESLKQLHTPITSATKVLVLPD